MAPFEYQSLDPTGKQIRLLDLHPGSGIIQCRLRHVSLTNIRGDYEALSYCWGSPRTQLVNILVNGLVFPITLNLHAALLRLRPADTDIPRTLWVDAICINQSDNNEKNTQLPLMRDIYSDCQRVIVWLGEHDALTEFAFKGVTFMASRWHTGERFNYYDWKKVQRGQNPNGLQRHIFLTHHLDGIVSGSAFNALFSRPWFKRTWVIQEVALPPAALVLCGKFQIDWELIIKALEISKTSFEEGTVARFRKWPKGLTDDIFCRTIMAWHQNVKDPRDKIYGLLGLHYMQSDDVPIQVDYDKPAGQIFTKFTRDYINHTGNLQTITICRGCKVAEVDLPSWSLDPIYHGDKEPLPRDLISWGFMDWEAYPNGFSAGGDTPSKPSFTGDLLEIMELQGFQFDSVVATSPINDPTPAPYRSDSVSGRHPVWTSTKVFFSNYLKGGIASWETAITFCQFYVEAKKMCEDRMLDKIYHPTGQDLLDAFWQVIRGRKLPTDHRDTSPDVRKQFGSFDRLLSQQNGRANSYKSITSITFAILSHPEIMEIFPQINATRRRRFFITEKGYMGLGPRQTEVGDSVVILKGYQAPVLTRGANSKTWRIVGESYIRGIMEGEVFDEGQCEPLWFE